VAAHGAALLFIRLSNIVGDNAPKCAPTRHQRSMVAAGVRRYDCPALFVFNGAGDL
jgi:hypothetical protein